MKSTRLTAAMLGTTDGRLKLLQQKLGIKTVEDALEYLPRGYEDLSNLVSVKEFRAEKVNVAKGRIGPISSVRTRGKMTVQKAMFTDEEGSMIECVWFRQPHLKDMFVPGDKVLVAGKLKFDGAKRVLSAPQMERVDKKEGGGLHMGRIVPVYSATGKLSAKWIREKIGKLKEYARQVEDWLPEEVRVEESLLARNEAVVELHFPRSAEKLEQAKERIAFEEVFLYQVAAARRKEIFRQEGGAPQIKMDSEVVREFIALQGFEPTKAQKIALYQILQDMEKSVPMVRLVQGDVGSGKTFVAVGASVVVMKAGYQVAFLAPTEILARQHYEKIAKQLEGGGVRVELLLGSSKAKEKREVKEGLVNGEVGMVVGTHALLAEDTEFKNLGLVVVDEQHRFGVEQREKLRKAGVPHFLSLSATPIPRSLALAMFGDTDVSTINEMPAGRESVRTHVVPPRMHLKALRFIEGELQKGRQVFFVYPLVNDSESEKLAEIKSATEQYVSLKEFYARYRVGLVHGQMKTVEKKKVMSDFAEGKINVLVATSVVEVGVDVPNATVMVIEGAERFGLAQLHQFRGRVGRGGGVSWCFLFTSNVEAARNARLDALEKTNDGFKLSEIDLQLRGPGAIFGLAQSGYGVEFKMANMLDGRLITRARKWAERILVEDVYLKKYPSLDEKVRALEVKRG